MSANATMIERVRKLFAKAESTTSDHERDALLSKAYDLLAKHGIEETLARSGAGEDSSSIDKWIFTAKGSYKLDQIYLVNAVAKALHCDAVRSGNVLLVYGAKRHLSRVEMLAGFLVAYMLGNIATLKAPFGIHATTYRKSAMNGFMSTVALRLRQAEKAAVDESSDKSGAEIVLVSDAERAAAALKEAHSRVVKGSATRRSAVGYSEGSSHGNRVDLGGSRIGGSRRALTV